MYVFTEENTSTKQKDTFKTHSNVLIVFNIGNNQTTFHFEVIDLFSLREQPRESITLENSKPLYSPTDFVDSPQLRQLLHKHSTQTRFGQLHFVVKVNEPYKNLTGSDEGVYLNGNGELIPSVKEDLLKESHELAETFKKLYGVEVNQSGIMTPFKECRVSII